MNEQDWIAFSRDIIATFGGPVVITHLDGNETRTIGAFVRPSQRLVAQTSISSTDVVCWVPGGLTQDVEEGDVVTVGETSYTVMGIEAIRPTTTVLAQALIVRR